MTPQFWQSLAAIIAAFAAVIASLYAVITRPLLRTIKAELLAGRAEMASVEARIKTELVGMEAQIASVEARLKGELAAMEARLIKHATEGLNAHTERIVRLEERRFKG